MHTAIVGEKGRVTIPKPLRVKTGIGPETVLSFRLRGGALIVEKVRGADDGPAPEGGDPVRAVLGCLKGTPGSDRLVSRLRGDA